MAENTQNKKQQKVRVPDEILEDLRKIEADALSHGKPRPVQGDLLLAAWRVYRGKTETEKVNDALKPAENTSSPGQWGKISPSEQNAVDLLFTILRHGTETVKKAIVMNLQGFTEPIKTRDPVHGISEGSPEAIGIPEALANLIKTLETVGLDEAASRKWLADLKQFQAELTGIRGKPAEHGKPHRKRRS